MDPTRAGIYPFTSPPGAVPFVVARSEGAWLFTPDGRRILDAAGGAILVNIGHGRREVAEAYARAAVEATYIVPPFATESGVRLMERLREAWLPDGIVLGPPFIVGEPEIDRMAEVLEASITSAVARAEA